MNISMVKFHVVDDLKHVLFRVEVFCVWVIVLIKDVFHFTGESTGFLLNQLETDISCFLVVACIVTGAILISSIGLLD